MAIELPFQQQITQLNTRLQDEWIPRYAALQAREQMALKLAAVALPCIVLLFGVILPLQDKKVSLQKSAAILLTQANEAVILASQLQQQGDESKPAAETGSLLSTMDALASAQGVRKHVTQMRPQSGMDGKQRLRVIMKNIPYKQAASFLLAMNQATLEIQQMKMKKSKVSGYVQLQLLLAKSE
ncbi:MAG: type II secretion system protein GspM [Mariprofundaceae bacterium]|nr:type II secretion system protein GspM [Mariprofundaceae bacterium]